MNNPIPTWKLILDCANDLTNRGKVPFTRKQLIECVQLKNPARMPGTINPTIQGMTVNLSGGPYVASDQRLCSVGRGQFVIFDLETAAPDLAAGRTDPPLPPKHRLANLDHYPEREIAEFRFRFICNLKPALEPDGSIRFDQPQSQYVNRSGISLNRYGAGPFCRLRIPGNISVSGVYAIIRDGCVLYIGECQNLSQRFNAGYGQISPRNCYQGGQETNCRMNTLVLREALAGRALSLYFRECKDYKNLEAHLRQEVRPEWNRI